MYVGRIPSDVVELILKHTVLLQNEEFMSWTSSFPLLAVCQEWRQIAQPLVFTRITVSSTLDDSLSCMNQGFQCVVDLGMQQHVRQISFLAESGSNPMQFVCSVLDRMAKVDLVWSKVNRLVFDLDMERFLANRIDVEQQLMDKLISEMGQVISNVTKLKLTGEGVHSSAFYGKIVTLYELQLRHLSSSVPLKLMGDIILPQVTHLSLQFDSVEKCKLPRVFASMLQFLVLDNMPHDYVWSEFMDFEHKEIVFEQLHELHIYYNKTPVAIKAKNHAEKAQRGLGFPQLKRLDICAAPEYCHILATSRFPSQMTSVSLDGHVNMLANLVNSRISRLANLDIGVAVFSPQQIAMFAHGIIQLAAIQVTESLALTVPELPKLAKVESIEWSHVTALTIYHRVCASRLLDILSFMPGLREIFALEVSVDLDAHQLKIPEPGSQRQQPHVIHAGIQKLDIELVHSRSGRARILVFAKHLLLHLPLLATASIAGVPTSQLQAFIMAKQTQYPHLATIEIY